MAAGGGVLAIVVADLIPDILANAREEGIALWLLGALGLGTFVMVGAWRGHHSKRVHDRVSDITPAFLSVHGLVEGIVVGAGAGVNVVFGLPALVGMVIHKAVEGVDLALYLRMPENVEGGALVPENIGRRRIGWLTLNAAAPLAGVLGAQTLPLPQIPFAVGMSMLSGLLLQVVIRICHDQLTAPVRRWPWLAFSGAFAVTLLLAVCASNFAG